MMNAAVGGSENVIGSSSATVSAGPIPGSTPTSVPSVTPAAASSRFSGVRTSAKPSIRLAAKTSKSDAPRPGRQLHVEPFAERVAGDDAEAEADDHVAHRLVGAEQPRREPYEHGGGERVTERAEQQHVADEQREQQRG